MIVQEWIKSFAIFWYILVFGGYIMVPKLFKLWKRSAMVGSIVVVGVLIYFVLLHLVCDLKAAQMNVEQSDLGTYALQVQTGL